MTEEEYNALEVGKVIGFTGSQQGMNQDQMDAISFMIHTLMPSLVHHGDCIGSDAIFHHMCVQAGIPIIIHPPTKSSKRAFCMDAYEVKKTQDYLVRNRNIVDACDILIAVPNTVEEKRRSGTWSTVRYAHKQGKEVYVVTPNIAEICV